MSVLGGEGLAATRTLRFPPKGAFSYSVDINLVSRYRGLDVVGFESQGQSVG